MKKRLTEKRLELKLGKLTTILDGLRKEAHAGELPGYVTLNIARACDSLNNACSDMRGMTMKEPRS